MNSQNEKSFFDGRTVLAVILVGLLFFGWQKYLENKYPDFYSRQNQTAPETTSTESAAAPQAEPDAAAATPVPAASPNLAAPREEQKIPFQFGEVSFEISSKGMGLHQFTVSGYRDREMKPIRVAISPRYGLYELQQLDSSAPLEFQLEKISENSVRGVAESNGARFEQVLTYLPEDQSLRGQLTVTGAPAGFKGFSYILPEQKQKYSDGTFFLPSIEHQEFVVRYQDDLERVHASSEKDDVQQTFTQSSLAAVGSQYFVSVFLDKSPVMPEVFVHAPPAGELLARISYKVPTVQNEMKFEWVGYAGAKNLTLLQKIDPALEGVVNFGFFSSIGKVLLVTLKWFHQFVGNWGVAIILLTLLVRLLVLPFNVASYKSMKKMQTIQPMLQSLRERYKEDPQALNRETMALMRKEKVNPLGGCLPMLLQMPVFFALYQVLGQSIELYQAPFVLWIQDLSLKDPFYVLPVLMGVTMYIQQKITPTTMDPQQARILQWMPVIFSVFTLALPAGLTLYIFISTLFGVIQQQVFMRDRKTVLKPAMASSK